MLTVFLFIQCTFYSNLIIETLSENGTIFFLTYQYINFFVDETKEIKPKQQGTVYFGVQCIDKHGSSCLGKIILKIT